MSIPDAPARLGHPLLFLLNPLPIEADVLKGATRGAFFLCCKTPHLLCHAFFA
jgi:hypothetical protein